MGLSPIGVALLTHLLAALAGGRLLLAFQVGPYRGYRGWGGSIGGVRDRWGAIGDGGGSIGGVRDRWGAVGDGGMYRGYRGWGRL